jgi:hypothetical protein
VPLLAAVGSWLLQELILAAPVVALAARWGARDAFLVLGPTYFVFSLVLSIGTIRLLRSSEHSPTGGFARWVLSPDHHPRTVRLLAAGGVLGFVVCAYLLGGPPTVWALHRLGVRRRLTRYAIVSSVIWGFLFVAWYAAATGLVLG